MQIEVMSLRGSQWLQLFLEQAQIGQMVEHWCKEHPVACSTYYHWKKALREEFLARDGGRARAPHPADGRHSSLQSIGRLPQIAVCHRLTVHKTVRPLAPCVPPRVRKPGQWCPE